MASLYDQNRRGSLLVEVLLTVVVLSISLNILIGGLLAGYRVTLLNSDYCQAMTLLENQMSRWRSQDYHDISVTNNLALESQEKFHLDFNIEPASFDQEQSLKYLNAVLSWKAGAKTMRIPLSTYFTQDDKK